MHTTLFIAASIVVLGALAVLKFLPARTHEIDADGRNPVVSGLGRVDGVPVYVTNGAGFWGPPVRVGAPPQVTVIDLRTP